jgi:Ca2+/H+ antiporter, TMEM165/GDT1 family
MEALVPAFLLALLSQLGERPPILTAILADRYGKPLTAAFAAGLAHAAGNLIAAAAGAAFAPILIPEASALLIAVALLLGGFGGLFPSRLKRRLDDWKLGALLTPLLGVFILALGDRTQFFTLALAARGEPWFAAAGASLGCFAVAFVAAVLGELSWMRLPLKGVRIAAALIFILAGVWMGLRALRLM